jgi:serine/threonine protein kinase
MGCCVSRAGDDAPGGASSSRYAPAEPESVETDALSSRGDAPDPLEDEWLSALEPEVREVFVELDAPTRLALAPALRRNAKRALSDEYDESTARRIGKGGFSVVYAVKHRRTGETFAAKVVSMRASEDERSSSSGTRAPGRRDEEDVESTSTKTKTKTRARASFGLSRLDALRALLCEAAVPALAPHESVVAFRDLILENRRAVLVQEFCPGGSLLDVVQKAVDYKRAARRAAAAETRRRSREHARSQSREDLSSFKGTRGVSVDSFEPAARKEAETTEEADRKPSSDAERRSERERMSAAADAHVAQHGGALSERDAKVACRRVARALARLHAAGFAHRDVKLENLLLARPNDLSSLKLADFGFATVVSDDKGRRPRCALFERKDATGDRLQGTVEYAAPEILVDLARAAEAEKGERGKKTREEEERRKRDGGKRASEDGDDFFSPSSDSQSGSSAPRSRERVRASALRSARPEADVWSLGVTTFLMLGGYHPFDAGAASRDARTRADETLALEFRKPQWSNVSADAKRVLERMLRTDPRARVTAEELLEDVWFRSDA